MPNVQYPTTARIVVVADAHLGQVPPTVAAAFHDFLDCVPQLGDHLLINGDLFDFWFEYQAVIPRKHFPTVAKLQALRAKGIPITFVGGNHDRWGGNFLTEDLGITFYAGKRSWSWRDDGRLWRTGTGSPSSIGLRPSCIGSRDTP